MPGRGLCRGVYAELAQTIFFKHTLLLFSGEYMMWPGAGGPMAMEFYRQKALLTDARVGEESAQAVEADIAPRDHQRTRHMRAVVQVEDAAHRHAKCTRPDLR